MGIHRFPSISTNVVEAHAGADLASIVAVAASGTLIHVGPGSYTATGNLYKNGVRWHFESGAVVAAATELQPIFDVADAGTLIVTGYAKFTTSIQARPFFITNAGATVRIEADEIESLDENSGSTPALEATAFSELRINARKVFGGFYDALVINVGANKRCYLDIDELVCAAEDQDCIEGDITAGGELYYRGQLVQHTNTTTPGSLGFTGTGGYVQIDCATIKARIINVTTGARMNVRAQLIESTVNGFQPLYAAGGTLEVEGARIVAGSTTAIAADPSGLYLRNCALVAGASATNSITAASAVNVRLTGCVTNKALHANVTNLITGGLTVDADVA